MTLPCNCEAGLWQGHCLCCNAKALPPKRRRTSLLADLLAIVIGAALGYTLVGWVYPCLRDAGGCRDSGFSAGIQR